MSTPNPSPPRDKFLSLGEYIDHFDALSNNPFSTKRQLTALYGGLIQKYFQDEQCITNVVEVKKMTRDVIITLWHDRNRIKGFLSGLLICNILFSRYIMHLQDQMRRTLKADADARKANKAVIRLYTKQRKEADSWKTR